MVGAPDVPSSFSPLPPPPPPPASTTADSERLLATLAEGDDPLDILEATAAIAGGPGGDDGGSSFVRLLRISESTSPLGLAYPRPGRVSEELPRLSGVASSETAGAAPQTSTSPSTPTYFYAGDDDPNNIPGRMGYNNILVGDRGGTLTKLASGKSYNLNLLVDLSDSMKWDWDGNPNPGSGLSRLEITKTALKSFLTNHVATHQGGDINVKLSWFPAGNGNVEVDEVLGVNINNPSTLQNLLDAIDNLTYGGATPYGQGFAKAKQWFDHITTKDSGAYAGYENMTLFLTDGEPNNAGLGEFDWSRQFAFEDLKTVSPKVHAIGLGPDMSQFTLDRFDTTDPGTTPAPDMDNVDWLEKSPGVWLTSDMNNWVQTNTGNVSTHLNGGHWLLFYSPGGTGGGSAILRQDVAEKMTLTDAMYADGKYFHFRYFANGSWSTADGSQFVWRLLKWDDATNDWVVAESGTPFAAPYGSNYDMNISVLAPGAGDYLWEFEFTKGVTDDKVLVINLGQIGIPSFHPTHMLGDGHKVTDPNDLGVVLESGYEYTLPVTFGDDVITGGDGNDILFGDAIHTDHLPWADVGGKPAGYIKTGMDALDDFLVAKLGLASVSDLTNADRYDFIKDNHFLYKLGKSDSAWGGGNDTLHGGAGDDILYGQGSNDVLYGGDGNDILVGGAGDDILWGGAGDDIFMWLDGDAGTVTNPANDVIKDFGMGGADPNGNDVLDLADLLIDEENGILTDYLNFTFDGSNTVIKVSTTGDLAGSGHDQLITLENVDLTNNNGWTQAFIIQNLLDQNKLLVDV